MNFGKKTKKTVLWIIIISIIVICVALFAVISTNKSKVVGKEEVASSNTESVEGIVEEEEVVEKADPSADTQYYATFDEDKYETKNDAGDVTCVNERNILYLKNDAYPKAAQIIQDTINGIMNDNWGNDIKRAADDYRNEGSKDEVIGIKYMAALEYQNSSVITFSIKMSGGFGGVTWDGDELYSFSTRTGERLSIENCSNDADKLKNELIQATKKYIQDNDVEIQDNANVGEDILFANSMSRQGSFGITENGICIKYQKYEIAAGGAGIIKISLDKGTSNSLLKDEYKIN